MLRPVIAALILLSLAVAAWAQNTVGPPTVKPGDRWVYKSGEGRRVLRVDSVESDGTIKASIETPSLGGVELAFTREWNPTMQPQAFAGHINYLRYNPPVCTMPPEPWTVGKDWSCESKYSMGDSSGSVSVKGKIEAMEKITVPAGTFDALRIKENVGGTETTLWYAPAAAQFVKIDAGANSPFSMELTSYELK
jgi:hypothetical protein